jgi:lysophospholipase L1-like esterase
MVNFFQAVIGAMVAAASAVAGVGHTGSADAVHSAAGRSAAVNYVALGDSYSSGLGAGDYLSGSGNCERSAKAFPQQWADAHAHGSFVSVTCADATTSSVLSSQVSALRSTTSLVSITIGGNDANFVGVMERCVLLPTSLCLHAVMSAESFVASQLPARLDATLRAIRSRAPSAKVVVLGYPDLFDLARSGSCPGLSTRDRTALNQGADDLDAALRTAAQASHDTFADVRGQFRGHEICDPGSWLYSLDLLSIGSSYHPTAAGQQHGYLPVFTAAA